MSITIKPEVGKAILETLTVGMYTDPLIVYREYVQNATDSIDNAVSQGLYGKTEKPMIQIKIESRKVTIHDNGTGISAEKASKNLLDIGKSVKDYTKQRGFRGIGRLGGLAYCGKLTFKASAKGEDQFTEVILDADKMKKELSPSSLNDQTATELIEQTASISTGKEKKDEHYFIVTMEQVTEPELIEEKTVHEYLCQVAPLDFHHTRFTLGGKIREFFKDKGLRYETYNIYLGDKQVHKPYTNRFRVYGPKDDCIRDANIFEHVTEDGKNSFFGWYAECHMLGSVTDDLLKGVRVRKGNILIGDEGFTKQFLTRSNERFCNWVIGELYVFDKDLIPNARRDSFEKSKAFDSLTNLMKDQFSDIVREIREKSKQREDPVKKKAVQIEGITLGVEKDVKNGFKSKTELEKAKQDVELAKDLHSQIESHIDKIQDEKQKEEKEKQAKELEKEIEKAAKSLEHEAFFKADLLTTQLSRKERKIIIDIFDEIYSELDKEEANLLIDSIIERLNSKGKKNDK